MDVAREMATALLAAPRWVVLVSVAATLVGMGVLLYTIIAVAAPRPRPPFPAEKTFVHVQADGRVSTPQPLPCWQDRWAAERTARPDGAARIEPAEVFLSLIIPAYNEEQRLPAMLTEAVDYLERHYPNGEAAAAAAGARDAETTQAISEAKKKKKNKKSVSSPSHANGFATAQAALPPAARPRSGEPGGWEIVLVSDGSTDGTAATALSFAAARRCSAIRVVSLAANRGKGGAVAHGLRHARGAYALFADADGATSFADLGRVVEACRAAEDGAGRGCAVGSRAHMVGSDAVVRRSALRNLLMHAFHLLIRTLTPPATARVRDTQCGFKLFSRTALPHIVPYMHSEGWIFDVEMLMLAEAAPAPGPADFDADGEAGAEGAEGGGIAVAEVPVAWHEVGGSKLNVVWDSIGMAWGLAILRLAWGAGVYRRW